MLIMICITTAASVLLSGDIFLSISGKDSWGIGGYSILVCLVITSAIVLHWNYSQNIWLPVICTNLLIFCMTILHSAGIDIFALHENILLKQYYWYVSTIGNINWFSGYLCLLLPLFAGFYISCQDKTSEKVYLVFLVPALLSSVLCASDSLYLGIGLCAFFAAPYIAVSAERMRRLCILTAVFGASLLSAAFLPAFADKNAAMHGIAGIFVHPPVAAAVFLIGLAGAVLLTFRKYESRTAGLIITLVSECLLSAGVVALFIKNAAAFGDSWGTNRGYIWRNTWEIFRKFSLLHKLLGAGPGMLRGLYGELEAYLGGTLLVSHSEPLQILVTLGAIGLLLWLISWGYLFILYFRKALWKHDAGIFFWPLAAYFGQSFVNSPQITNFAIMTVIAGVLLLNIRDIKPERGII